LVPRVIPTATWPEVVAPGSTGHASRAESQTVTTRWNGRANSSSTDLLVWEEMSTPASAITSIAFA
jgi:hypothetical protein